MIHLWRPSIRNKENTLGHHALQDTLLTHLAKIGNTLKKELRQLLSLRLRRKETLTFLKNSGEMMYSSKKLKLFWTLVKLTATLK